MKADTQDLDKALWTAVDYDREAEVRLLLSLGANPDATAPDGMPCSFASAARGETEILKALLAAGADPLLRCRGQHALNLAIVSGGAGPTRAILDSAYGAKIFKEAFGALKVQKRPTPNKEAIEPSAKFLFGSALEIALWAEKAGLEKNWTRWKEIHWAAEHWGNLGRQLSGLGLGDWEPALDLAKFLESREQAKQIGSVSGNAGATHSDRDERGL